MAQGHRPRVLLADDHPLMLEGLRKLLGRNLEIVGAVTDGCALLEAAKACRPELIIVDISMPGIDGVEAARRLRDLVPETRVLVLSIHGEPSWVQAAFDAGAQGYLTKASAPQEVETAVREVLRGNFYVSPAVTQAVLLRARMESGEPVEAPLPAAGALTPREAEIVRLVGRGLSNKEIAHELGLSVATIRTHLANVYEKIGSGSRVELALFAAQAQDAVM